LGLFCVTDICLRAAGYEDEYEDEDVEDEDDEGSAEEEMEEPERRQRRAMTTPHVLELADAGIQRDLSSGCRRSNGCT